MSFKLEWQHFGVLLVVLLVVFAVGCGGGGKKHSTGVGYVPTGDSPTTSQGISGSREVSIVTPPEGFSDLSVLPPRLQELFNQPVWNMPIAPATDNVMTPPDPPEFIIEEAIERARSLEFKLRGIDDARTTSYIDDFDEGFVEEGLLDEDEVPFDEDRAVEVPVLRGSAVVFHDLTVHASTPNMSGRDRCALVATYRDGGEDDLAFDFATAAFMVRGRRTGQILEAAG